jgi:hypothetical protein
MVHKFQGCEKIYAQKKEDVKKKIQIPPIGCKIWAKMTKKIAP